MNRAAGRDAAGATAGPWYGFYGDDFTGATDTLAQLAQAGLRTLLFMAMPDAARLRAVGPLDAVGVAGAARAMTPLQLQALLPQLGRGFAELGVRVLHYKVCSTFDSAPGIGSIGAAVKLLRPYFPNPLVAIVGGQPDLRRYCSFGTLFAAAHDGEVYRLDRHPTMSRHPSTPMGEADLRLHLHAQGLRHIGLFDYGSYTLPFAQCAARLHSHVALALDAVLFDVMEPAHLPLIGALLAQHARAQPLLVVGASSVAQALCAALAQGAAPGLPAARFAAEASAQRGGEQPNAAEAEVRPGGVGAGVDAHAGPRQASGAPAAVFVLAGSLSPLTAQQIDAALSYEKIELDPVRLCGAQAHDYIHAQASRAGAHLRAGRAVLAFTARAVAGADAGERMGPAHPTALARACGELLRQVLEQAPLRRVAVAGGDTSSHAMQALDAWGLSCLGRVCAGVALSRLHANPPHLDGLEIVLKGGQMGPVDLFERLLEPHALSAA